MRKINNLFVFMMLIVAFASCSEVEPLDPVLSGQIDSGNNSNSDSGSSGSGNSIVGTYTMTVVNSSVPTDLNGDNITSINQMNETSCFSENNLILSSNNTFTSTSKGVDIGVSGLEPVIECYTDPSIFGTWLLAGNILALNYVFDNEQFVDILWFLEIH